MSTDQGGGRPQIDQNASAATRQQIAKPATRWTRWWEFVLLCLAFGLLLGLTEAVLDAIAYRFHFYSMCMIRVHFHWAPSAVYGSLFALGGLVLGAIVWTLPEEWKWKVGFRGTVLILAIVYAFQVVDHADEILQLGISDLSQWIFAFGAGVALCRLVCRYDAGLFRLVRYAAPALAVVAIGWPLGNFLIERQEIHQVVKPPPPKTPNVLLVVWDTVRAESLSVYGHTRRTTPTLERLASTGVLFDHAIATSPWTLPSHAGIMTGHPEHAFPDIERRGISKKFTTLAEVLQRAGYNTGGFVANSFFCHRYTGMAQGFEYYDDCVFRTQALIRTTRLVRNIGRQLIFPFIGDQLKRAQRHRSAAQINESFLAWQSRNQDRPFFAFLNYMEAHHPYHPPEPFQEEYGPKTEEDRDLLASWADSVPHPEKITSSQRQMALDAYEGCIAWLDQQLDLLLEELDRRGQLDNTLVIVLSDHGEEFGEHGVYTHGTSLYEQQTRVPLLMALNGRVPANRRVAQTVSLSEIPATVLGLLGIGPSGLPGQSLTRYWDAEGSPESVAASPVLSELTPFSRLDLPQVSPAAKGPIRAVWSDKTKYIHRDCEPIEELYDLAADPLERNNLAPATQCGAILHRLQNQFARMVPGLEGHRQESATASRQASPAAAGRSLR